MQRMMLCPLMALVMLTITATCNAQNIFWLQGSWQGKAYLPGSAASQYYNLILRIYNIKDNKFEGIITTMQPSDTSIRFDSKISGIVYDKYLIIHRNKILYIKNPPGIGWKVSCNNCKPPPMIFSIENGKFFFKGEAKDCYKECNGMSEFSKDITEFDSSGKKSLYALVNGVQKPEADTISVAQNSNPSLQDTVASLSKENNLITERIPVLPAGNITLTERNTASRLSQKPPGSLYKTSSLIIQENEPITQRTPVLAAGNITLAEHNTTLLLSQKPLGSLYKTSSLIIQENEPITQRIPVLPAGNITLAEHNIALLLPQKSPRSLRRNSPSLIIQENITPLVKNKIPSTSDTMSLTGSSNTALQKTSPPSLHDTIAILPAGYAERKKNVVRTLIVNTDSIVLRVYDNGIVDGDIVSVVYNDKVVVDKLSLTAHALVIKIPVNNQGINTLVFHAHNLGEYPPNTAKLEILYGNKREELTVSSDYTVSSTIDIVYKQ